MLELNQNKFLTVKQLAEKFPCFTQHAIRWLLFHSQTNGLESCIIRIGRKILFDENLFTKWLKSHGSSKELSESRIDQSQWISSLPLHNSKQRLVLNAMSAATDMHGRCYLSCNEIAAISGLDCAIIKSTLLSLIDAKFIISDHAKNICQTTKSHFILRLSINPESFSS